MYVSFDLEMHRHIPPEAENFFDYSPLGISCAAIATPKRVLYFESEHRPKPLSVTEAEKLVYELLGFKYAGYEIVTWNGANFDFRVLAEESRLYDKCKYLALNHIDLMFLVVAHKGHYLALKTAAKRMAMQQKLKSVKLRDGQPMSITGGFAPSLWSQGEFDAVREYLEADARVTLELANLIDNGGRIEWISRSGKLNFVKTEMLQVKDALNLPLPDTSWMTSPPRREDILAWVYE